MMFIAEQLRAGRPLQSSEVIERFEVTKRTVFRDLEFMRDRLGWKFSYDAQNRSFKLNVAPKAIL